eukprot:gene4211-764_t
MHTEFPWQNGSRHPKAGNQEEWKCEDQGMYQNLGVEASHRNPNRGQATVDEEEMEEFNPKGDYPARVTCTGLATESGRPTGNTGFGAHPFVPRGRAPRTTGATSVETEEAVLSGTMATCGNAFISFIGTGILGLPYMYGQAGFLPGTIGLLLVASVSLYTMLLVAKCKDSLTASGHEAVTYGDLGDPGDCAESLLRIFLKWLLPLFSAAGKHAYGAIGSILVDVSIILTQTGFCTAYVLFISRNVPVLFCSSTSEDSLLRAPGLADVSSSPALWPAIKALSVGHGADTSPDRPLFYPAHEVYLAPFSIYASVANMFGITLLFGYSFNRLMISSSETIWANWRMFPQFIGAATYCYEAVGLVLPVKASMKHKKDFSFVWTLNLVLVSLLLWSFGMTNFKAYGNQTEEIILWNILTPCEDPRVYLPTDQPHPDAKIRALEDSAVSLTLEPTVTPTFEPSGPSEPMGVPFTSPYQPVAVLATSANLAPTMEPVEDSVDLLSRLVLVTVCTGLFFTYPLMLFPVFQVVERNWLVPKSWQSNAFRIAVVLVTAFIAWKIPKFSLFISFVGATACSLLAYVLPALFDLKIRGQTLGPLWWAIDIAVVVFGCVIMVLGTAKSVQDLQEELMK